MASRYMRNTTRPLRSTGHHPVAKPAGPGVPSSIADTPVGYKPAGAGSATNFNRTTKWPLVKHCVAKDGLAY